MSCALEDPGYDVDLYLACTLPDIIYIIRGDLPVSRAISDARLDVHGTGGRAQSACANG